MKDQPRAYTGAEIRRQFMDHARAIAASWASHHNMTPLERCSGVVHSMLAMIDGCVADMPAFRMFPDPHPDDKKYRRENGENWYPENGHLVGEGEITDVMLHEELYNHPSTIPPVTSPNPT